MGHKGFFSFETVVRDDERAFLTRSGRFEALLGPGRYRAFDLRRELAAETFKVIQAEIPATRALMLRQTHPEIVAAHFEIVQAGPMQVAIVSFDGDPKHVVLPN